MVVAGHWPNGGTPTPKGTGGGHRSRDGHRVDPWIGLGATGSGPDLDTQRPRSAHRARPPPIAHPGRIR